MDGQNQNPLEPMDISQAFQMLRDRNSDNTQGVAGKEEPAGTQESLDAGGEGVDAGQQENAGVPEAGGIVDGEGEGDVDVSVEPDVGDGAGGSSAESQDFDYSASRNTLIKSLQEQARRETAKTFQDHNVKIMSIQDIYRRDEDGIVHFDNPDDPNREFSSRAEAQAWIESMNKEINRAFNEEAMKRMQELYRDAQPAIMLLEFAPMYDAMSDDVKTIFNDLVEPYSVYNQAGEIIGFSCNLNQVAAQAQTIASRFTSKSAQQQSKQEDNTAVKASKDQGPAMDIKTGSGVANDNPEPKNVEEAMMLLNKARKDKSNG